jgi:cyclopropane fatty-acyl-phospholipid synthase-like methyltransferase
MVSADDSDDGAIARADARRIVREGYDRIADRYATWSIPPPGGQTERFLAEVLAVVPDGAEVLDLGCGQGAPVAQALAERCRVTGVDASRAQLERARARVPAATFVEADVATLERARSSVDAVTAFYSLTHLPRDDQTSVVSRVVGWLRPGGVFCATLGGGDTFDEVEPDWLGVPMFFAGFAPDENRRLLANAGLSLEVDDVVDLDEPDGIATFHYVIARKPAV